MPCLVPQHTVGHRQRVHIEDYGKMMDQQRIDELQNQYFRQKLATVDAKRLKEAQEFLEHHRRPCSAAEEPVRPKAPAPHWPPRMDGEDNPG